MLGKSWRSTSTPTGGITESAGCCICSIMRGTAWQLKDSLDAVLWVLIGNERAKRFYRLDGWIPDGQRRDEEVHGITVDELRYRRPLP